MGALIGQALVEDGMAQAEFARRVGSSAKHVNQVINGHAVATHALCDYWAWVLGRRWSITLEHQ